jgi:hypothetical protein
MILAYWVKSQVTKKNTEALLDLSKDIGLQVKAEESKVRVHVSSPDWRTKSLYKGG